tara:strand:+ start:275 stop:493 length:219 start_codon:yes stop_codon:yes gene_type:complete
MNEQDFLWLMTWVFGGFGIVSIVLMILEETLLRLYPHKYWREESLSKELDLLYLELQEGKEINIAEYIKENK